MKTKNVWTKYLGGLPFIAIALIFWFRAPKGLLKTKKLNKKGGGAKNQSHFRKKLRKQKKFKKLF